METALTPQLDFTLQMELRVTLISHVLRATTAQSNQQELRRRLVQLDSIETLMEQQPVEIARLAQQENIVLKEPLTQKFVHRDIIV